jgi:membrane protease YdiL (CAAX protease family)
MTTASKQTSRPGFGVLWLWLALLAALTATGVLWLRSTGTSPADGFSPAILVIAYAPSLAALVASGVFGGYQAVRGLLGQIGRWRFAFRWYATALLLPVVVVGLAQLLYRLAGGTVAGPWLDVSGLAIGFGAVIAGSLGEELGWRGLAQPLLQKRLNIFWASVVVGFVWATWHCWPVLAPGGQDPNWLLDVGLTYLRLVPTAILYGWLYNVTGKSLLVVMLAHAAHNVVVTSLPVPADAYGLAALVAALYALAAVVVVWFARRQLFVRPN